MSHSNSIAMGFTMTVTVLLRVLIMVCSWLGMEKRRMEKNIGSSRTAGVPNGETMDTLKLAGTVWFNAKKL